MPAIDTVNVRNGLLDPLNPERARSVFESQTRQVDYGQSFEYYWANYQQTLRQHPMYYVSPQMMQIALAAAGDMEAEEDGDPMRLERYDLPSPRGFMYFPSGMTEIDVRGKPISFNAVAWWMDGSDYLHTAWYTDKANMQDEANRQLYEENPDVWVMLDQFEYAAMMRVKIGSTVTGPGKLMITLDGEPLPEDVEFQFSEDQNAVSLWRVVDGKRVYLDKDADKVEAHNEPGSKLSVLVAIWHLMHQTLAALTEEEPDRAARKRSKKLDALTKVTVIELRHRESRRREGPGSEVDWSHRWLRRGHWRRQWFKDDEGEWRRKEIYIQPTVCGPEDKPLVIREHVNALMR